MTPHDDTRAQAVQIGAVLLFAALILAMTSYQTAVVPDQNAEIEHAHNQEAQDGMLDLRNAIVTSEGRAQRDVTIPLGTRYPERTLFLNPAPPSGQLETIGGTMNVSNVSVSGGARDFWGESQNFSTGIIEYRPDYNELDDAPTTVIEGSLAYNRFDSGETRTLAEPTLIDGNRISLVALEGNVSASASGDERISVHRTGRPTRTVTVTNDTAGHNVTISMPTRRSESEWSEYLDDAEHVSEYSVTANELEVVFDRTDENGHQIDYELSVTRAGLNTDVEPTDPAYITLVGDDNRIVQTGGEKEITFEVRDRYDEPVEGKKVNFSVVEGGGSLVDSDVPRTTDANGQIDVVYTAPDEGGEATVGASYAVTPSIDQKFDAQTPKNATASLRVVATGSSGPYSVAWNRSGLVDVDDDGEKELEVRPGEDPFIASVTAGVASGPIEFAVEDGDVIRRNEETSGSIQNGSAQFGFDLNSTPRTGEWYIYVSSRGSGDRLPVYVNTTGDTSSPTISNFAATNPSGRDVIVSFDSDESLTGIEVTLDGPETVTLDEGDFSESGGTYTANYDVSSDGAYTATLHEAVDAAGNDGATGQNDPVLVGKPVIFAINAGGTSYTDSDGVTYVADDGSGSQYTTGGSAFSNTNAIANTDDDALYQSERYASDEEFSYDAAVDDGTYEVTFKFAEIYFGSGNTGGGGDGSRVLDVLAEDEVVIDNLDVHNRVGENTALELTRTVTVTDGTLNLAFSDEVENAKASAIVVRQVPDARISASPSAPSTADTITFQAETDDSSNIQSYEWTFGDGTTATGETVTHSYDDDGTYTATLTVTDNNGVTNTVAREVQVDNVAPTANLTYSPSPPSTADTVVFDDTSSDPDGSIVSREWEFGDGSTASGESVTHSYDDDGTYQVTLTVTDDDGTTATTSTTITVANVAPSASFTVTPTDDDNDGEIDRIVYDASASTDPDGQIEYYEWEIGGDSVYSGTYNRTDARLEIDVSGGMTSVGSGTVSLTVTDDDGAATETTKNDTSIPTTPGMETFAVVLAVLVGAALRRRDYL